jgi:methionyl-tRNA formyltransferase
VTADKKNWIIACGKGALRLAKIVPQGKKEMSGADFLRGKPMEEGAVLCD